MSIHMLRQFSGNMFGTEPINSGFPSIGSDGTMWAAGRYEIRRIAYPYGPQQQWENLGGILDSENDYCYR